MGRTATATKRIGQVFTTALPPQPSFHNRTTASAKFSQPHHRLSQVFTTTPPPPAKLSIIYYKCNCGSLPLANHLLPFFFSAKCGSLISLHGFDWAAMSSSFSHVPVSYIIVSAAHRADRAWGGPEGAELRSSQPHHRLSHVVATRQRLSHVVATRQRLSHVA